MSFRDSIFSFTPSNIANITSSFYKDQTHLTNPHQVYNCSLSLPKLPAMTSPSGVHVGPHPTKGKALYASRPYEAGDHIFTAPPLMCRPLQNNIERVCAHCLTVGEPRGCSRCHRVFYCDAACQRAAWKTHGKECKALSNLTKGLEPPTIVRSVMQALLVKDIGDRVMELEGNLNIWEEDTAWATFQLVASGAVTYAGLAMNLANLKRASDLLFKVRRTILIYITWPQLLIFMYRFKQIVSRGKTSSLARLAFFSNQLSPGPITPAFPMPLSISLTAQSC